MEDDMPMSERERLLSLLFDRSDKKVLNVKFFRGNARSLTAEQLCKTAHDVISDTWDREGSIKNEPPVSQKARTAIHSL